ncbi:hypothetical protein RSAG8_08720, partial [Rhizoctonia solani AG-8 WAC10335]
MADPHHPSSPIKWSVPPTDTRSATQTAQDIDGSGIVQNIACKNFCNTYLSRSPHKSWAEDEGNYVSQIRKVPEGQEMSLYTGYAPLLRLLNSMSKNVADDREKALVFRAGYKCRSDAFQQMDYSEDESSTKIWTQLAAVGEAKVSATADSQLTGYLQNHLRFHPELNAALGFSIRSTGYVLFYHDAAVVHRSEFKWEPGPLYEFMERLYTQPFQDPSMQIQSAQPPRWATKIGNDVYLSRMPNTPGGPDVQGGPGERRYTAGAENDAKNDVFIKDTWRDESRYFFEGLLLKRAHEDKPLCGLILPSSHGYVLDETGTPIRTTHFNSGSGTEEAPVRFKMRMVTNEIGQPLEGVHSLYKFLCAMYDACAVQRNLYRKCRIMHRDISDKNIMFAPDTEAYRERNRKGYAEVKFVNQVLAKGENVDPAPACLMIDLGNGADLGIERGLDALTERTGTPKFIARSVSSGELLHEESFSSTRVKLPPIEGPLTEYHQRMHTAEYQISDTSDLTTESEAKFAHRLFHDAESTFWVIAWTLARSTKKGSNQETKPHAKFCHFFHIMSKHYPIPGVDDSRQVTFFTKENWESVLHTDLAMLAAMLANMFRYIRPEWAYRPELNAEHVHEALMRLLLIEIINIKNGTDIDIDIGGRRPPPPLLGQDPLPQSITSSRSKSLARSQTSRSIGPQTGSAGGSSKRQHESLSATSETSGSNKRTRANTSDGPATRTRLQLHNALAQPQEQESKLVWPSGPCKLQEPKSHGKVDPLSSRSPE